MLLALPRRRSLFYSAGNPVLEWDFLESNAQTDATGRAQRPCSQAEPETEREKAERFQSVFAFLDHLHGRGRTQTTGQRSTVEIHPHLQRTERLCWRHSHRGRAESTSGKPREMAIKHLAVQRGHDDLGVAVAQADGRSLGTARYHVDQQSVAGIELRLDAEIFPLLASRRVRRQAHEEFDFAKWINRLRASLLH